MANKFKSTNNIWLTSALFADVAPNANVIATGDRALYWLENRKDETDKRHIFKDLYIKLKDPTGVKAAQLYLDGFAHFEYLMEGSPWFKEAITRWNREIDAIIQSEAIQRVRNLAEGAGGEAVQLAANKYLANLDYKKTGETKRGRPTAKEVQGELVRQARSSSDLVEDFQRMKRKEAN